MSKWKPKHFEERNCHFDYDALRLQRALLHKHDAKRDAKLANEWRIYLLFVLIIINLEVWT